MYKKIMRFFKNTLDTIGANILADGKVKFRIWAPDAKSIDLIIKRNNGDIVLPMKRDKKEFFSLTTDIAHAGTLYQYKINKGLAVPDPVSKFQPYDVHGPSEVIAEEFDWEDDLKWKGRPWEEAIIYELHIGTFTEAGTFLAAVEKLDHLVELGITAIEIMPVSDFPGKRNWGYDGVLPFAPDSSYGRPEDLKNLIKEAHKRGLMVFLDVVYNHFGPEGNYLWTYASSRFFTDKYKTPWGSAINFENGYVREFFILNAIYWLETFRFDGLRFDAVHAIFDQSAPDIIEEINARVRSYFKDERYIHLVLENDNNETKYLNALKEYKGFDAQWNDDFHHCAHILATGEDKGYYIDYTKEVTGQPASYFLGRTLTEGFAYQGEISPYREGKHRGKSCTEFPLTKFVTFIQNHDQIGNRPFGNRLSTLAYTDMIKAIACIYLMAPSVPLLFMGEEWNASTPFQFFCDFEEALAKAVRKGRSEEFSRFPEFSNPEIIKRIPDPTAENTFKKSKLNWDELNIQDHSLVFKCYKELIRKRKQYITPEIQALNTAKGSFNVINDRALVARWEAPEKLSLLAYINLNNESINDLDRPVGYKLIAESRNGTGERLTQKGILSARSVCWFSNGVSNEQG